LACLFLFVHEDIYKNPLNVKLFSYQWKDSLSFVHERSILYFSGGRTRMRCCGIDMATTVL
jgi:hypothetical protein